MKKLAILMTAALSVITACSVKVSDTRKLDSWESISGEYMKDTLLTVSENEIWFAKGDWRNFILTGKARTTEGSTASVQFHTDGNSGYEVALHNGPIDGTIKSGSLTAVRNLYRSLAEDGEWFGFEIAVREKNISVKINGTDVVCYTEPEMPYRTDKFSERLLSEGKMVLKGYSGKVDFKEMAVTSLSDGSVNPCDTLPPVNEQTDSIIRLQQAFFPVIDYHVHLKGGLTAEMASAKSMNYGINYGVAPNAGDGGVGRMLRNDEEVIEYYEEMKDKPFLRGVQGEGRRWIYDFSKDTLDIFDYLFTDAMTITDLQGRNSRIYRNEEVHFDGITYEQYMGHLVSQTVKILTNEPADIYANPTYLPQAMMEMYDIYWTEDRINAILDVLKRYNIALEINAGLRLPSFYIIRLAKARGIKFTFGSNNSSPDFGRLEYCIEAINQCGLTPSDLWFPTMSIRSSRKPTLEETVQE